MRPIELLPTALRFAVIATALAAASVHAQNPCATKNPCAPKNPCAVKNPCAPKNPCAAPTRIDPRQVTRPAGTTLVRADAAALAREGDRLFHDTKLSGNGLSCQGCHANGASFNASFAQPYPHRVAMPEARAGLKQVALDEMVQFCMVAAMAGKPLPWSSRELAALTTYTGQLQKDFQKTSTAPRAGAAMNPCAPKNPCAAK